MLALLSPTLPSFCPDNICAAVLLAVAPQTTLELLTARGRSAQMAGRGCQETGTGWREMAGRNEGSHMASVLAFCPGAPSVFPQQKACQELEVTLSKMLYSHGGLLEEVG